MNCGPESVLIVDDDLSFVTFVADCLSSLNYDPHVMLAGSGVLARVTGHSFFAVLLDLGLPDIDGLTVLEQMKAQGVVTPVIVITGGGSVPQAVQAIKLGAEDFIEKPLRTAHLRALLERCRNAGPGVGGAMHHHASHRLARAVVTVVEHPSDVRTVGDWAELLGLSVPVLYARCAAVGCQAKACLDLARVIRCLRLGASMHWRLGELFDNGDSRTTRALLERGGLGDLNLSAASIATVLSQQRFVTEPDLIDEVRSLLDARAISRRNHAQG